VWSFAMKPPNNLDGVSGLCYYTIEHFSADSSLFDLLRCPGQVLLDQNCKKRRWRLLFRKWD